MGRKVDYFTAAQVAPTEEACALVDLDPRMAPAIIRGLLPYTQSPVWVSAADFDRGYQKTAKAMAEVLMDCSEVIVNNIIAARGLDPAAPRDPVTGVPIADPTPATIKAIVQRLDVLVGDQQFYGDQHTNALNRIEAAIQQGLLTEEGGELVSLLAKLLLVL